MRFIHRLFPRINAVIRSASHSAVSLRPASVLDVLLPTSCLLCQQTSSCGLLCFGCKADLPYLHGQDCCIQCGITLAASASYCGECLRHPPAFSRSCIPFSYAHPLATLIHQFKYGGHLTYGKVLGQLLAEHLQHAAASAEVVLPDVLISTPMHWRKRWQRGFNQADILAGYIADAVAIPVATHWVRRVRPTPAQKELTRAERQQNLREVFVVNERHKVMLAGKRIAIVDDVITTTATMRELSRCLIKAGALDVQVWGLARTL